MFDLVLAGGRVVDAPATAGFGRTWGFGRPDRRRRRAGRAEARRRLDVAGRVSRLASSTRTSTPTWRSSRTRSTRPLSARASLLPPGPGRRRDGPGFTGDPRVHAALHGGVQRARRGAGPLVEHGGYWVLRSPGGGERRGRCRREGLDGRDGAPAGSPRRTSWRGCAGSSARRWRRARSAPRAARRHPEPLRPGRGRRSSAGRSRRTAVLTRPHGANRPRTSSARWTRSSGRARGRVAVLISHFNSRRPVLPHLDRARAAGPTWPSTSTGTRRLDDPRHDRAPALGPGGRGAATLARLTRLRALLGPMFAGPRLLDEVRLSDAGRRRPTGPTRV